MTYIHTLIFLFLCLTLPVLGQIEIQFNQLQPTGGVEAVWDVTLINSTNEDLNIWFRAVIRDKSQAILYRAKSHLVHLQPGTRNIKQLFPDHIEKVGIINKFEENLLPPGDYTFSIGIYYDPLDIRIGGKTQNVTVLPRPEEEKKDRKIPILFSGTGRLTQYNSTRQGTGSQVPPSYFRAELFPTLTIAEVPIGANVLLSTENRFYRQPINQVSLNFDARQFKENLRNKLLQRFNSIQNGADLLDIERYTAFRERLVQEQFPDLEVMRQQLSNSELEHYTKDIGELDRLTQTLENPFFKENQAILNQLEEKHRISSIEDLEAAKSTISPGEYEQMQELYQFKAQAASMEQRKNKLKQQTKKIKNKMEMAEQVRKIKTANMRNFLSNPKDVKAGLNEFGLNNTMIKLFSCLRSLNIGTVYPYYSRLTFNGLSLTKGVHASLNPGEIIYVAATYGKTTRQALDTSRFIPKFTFDQKVLGIRAGIGSPDKSHLIFSYIQIQDQSDSLYIDYIRNRVYTPQENYIFGSSMQLSFFENNVVIGGELNGSLYNRDKMATAEFINPLEDENFPFKSFLSRKLNNSSSVDIAGRGSLDIRLFNNATRIRSFASWVGPGYINLAAPMIIQDRFRWRAELRQSIKGNSIQLIAHASRDVNQLTPYSALNQNEITSFGGTFRLQLPKLPFLLITYAPYQQHNRNAATNSSFQNTSTMINVLMGHNFKIGKKAFFSTQAGFIRQTFNSPQANGSYSTNIYSMNQTVSAGGIFTFSLNGSYQPRQQIANTISQVFTINMSGTGTFFKKWSNALGFQYLKQNTLGNQLGYYYRSSYPIHPKAILEVRIQRNAFEHFFNENNGYGELVASAVLNLRW